MNLKRFIASLVLFVPLASYAVGFDGVYVGGYLGYSKAKDDGTGYNSGTTTLSNYTQKTKPNGNILGVFGGYNWVLSNNLVLGLEADYERRLSQQDTEFQKFFGLIDSDYALKTKLKSAASLRARLGFLIHKRTLLYATGGFASARVKRTWEDNSSGTHESHTDWQDGWTAGIGLEHLYNDNITARIEFRHSDYGDRDIPAIFWGEYYDQDLKEDSIRAGVSIKFN